MLMSRALVAAFTLACFLPAQTPPPSDTVIFQSKVNLVPVPVVVRDKNSHAVGNLTKDDFQLFDDGKKQAITRFSVETSGVAVDREPGASHPGAAQPGANAARASGPPIVIPDRFVAYVFDDLHFNIEDLMQARIAALKHFDAQTDAATRAAVFTTSGMKPEDFTADRAQLKAALNRLMPRSRAGNAQTDCPYLGYSLADTISNQNNSQALQDAAKAAFQCPVAPRSMQEALNIARRQAYQEASLGETETRITLSTLRNIVKRVAALPGQRILVLVSPGFIFPSHEQDISQLIDQAVRVNVVINAIDGRGLYVDSRYDGASRGGTDPLMQYKRDQATETGQTLSLIAEGTGGTAFGNNNDLLEGFRRTSSPPEFTYVIGFSPENLKLDGKFHNIKVKLKNSTGLTVQARRGYFAPRHAADPADQAKQDIDDALFSRQEMNDFPLAINTQISKGANNLSKLTVVMQVGLKSFHFYKADGLNRDHLTLVAGLFDQNGNYVTGTETNADLKYKDEVFQARVNAGLALKTNFDDVKPGSYLIRLVARDSEGQTLATTNGAVEVP
jgi:VWFA-related protein